MKFVEPLVHLVGETVLREEDIEEYLDDVGADDYEIAQSGEDITDLTMIAGKLCYRSFSLGLNPNVTRIREDVRDYINNIHKVAHGSVLEHGYVSFIFHNVSRVFTHELVRHRVGVGISQESLRFVRLTDIPIWFPPVIKENSEALKLGVSIIKKLEEGQKRFAEIFELDKKNFEEKKFLTSHMRRFAPIGLATSMLWTCNIRTLRHVIQQRTYRGAEEEIRKVFSRVAEIVTERYPILFEDFHFSEIGRYKEWTTAYAAMPYDQEKLAQKDKEIAQLKSKILKMEEEHHAKIHGRPRT